MPRAKKPTAPPPSSQRAEEPVPRPRAARRRDRSREEILEAVRSLIVERGLRALTLDDVAREVGLTKAALYYYFPSKDALLDEFNFRSMQAQSQRLHDAVEQTGTGPEVLRTVIGETIRTYAQRLDDFRCSYLHPQLAPEVVRVGPEQLARVRPLNDLSYAGAARRLANGSPGRAGVDPRLMVFLAHLAALGVLTMKGLVETFDDPLRYSDEELIDGLARIFESAARP